MAQDRKYYGANQHSFVTKEKLEDGSIRKEVDRNGRKRSKPLVYMSHKRLAQGLNGREKLVNFALGYGFVNDSGQ